MQSPDNSGGITRISERSVSRIVEAATLSVPGSVRVDGGLAGRSYPRFDVEVDDTAGTASVEAFIAVSWPSPVTSVAESVRAAIKDWIIGLCGLRPVAVNVVTGPVVSNHRRVTQASIDAAPVSPVVTPIRTRNRVRIQTPQVRCSLTELRPVSVSRNPARPKEVISPHVAPAAQLTKIQTAPEQPLKEIKVNELPETQDVKVRSKLPEVPVTVPKPAPLKPVKAPKQDIPLKRISYPRDHRPVPVRIQSRIPRRKIVIKKGGH
ncbi:Asp23/Gls24 family envelope stress response protein [Corynebacterium sp. 3HC-13]|uniref:Asp23/Gls24 family envelope stress response protein n=1 Tax=Corynebacterium poyangense TaxID=2684405 RepID=UPI001CCF60C1|nr:Asp23/Gls24 family envelope stress response protein [Corynebacterium poyangense]MBZ8177698.1 Asp23/Gls24 family envelope stress response protein [Corynebacterium poyangense]